MATDKSSADSTVNPAPDVEVNALGSMQRLISLAEIRGIENRLRPISGRHLLELAASIASHGLVSPISVDANRLLLAGGHRLSAFHLLRHAEPIQRQRALLAIIGRDDVDPEHPPADLKAILSAAAELDHDGFVKQHPGDLIPARVFDFDSRRSEKRALAIEIAENEKRQNFSKNEVKEIVAKLEAAGYTSKHGKLKADEKPLIPELKTILRISRRSIFRLLEDQANADGAKKGKSNRGRKKDPQWKHAYKHFLGSAALINLASKLKEDRPKEWDRFLEAIKKVTLIAVELDQAAENPPAASTKKRSKPKAQAKAKRQAKA